MPHHSTGVDIATVPLEVILAEKFDASFTRAEILRALEHMPGIQRSMVTLPADEGKVYDEAGFGEDSAAYQRQMISTTVAFAQLLDTALTTEQAAQRIGVDASRIRQRIAERTVWAVRDGRRWLLPVEQFDESRLVRGLEAILPTLPEDEHPLTVLGLLTAPQDGLVIDGRPQSVIGWLRSGGGVDAVVGIVDAHQWSA